MTFRFPFCAVLAAIFLPAGLLWSEEPAPAPTEPKATTPAPDAKATIDPKAIEVLRKSFAAQQAKGTFRARMEIPDNASGAQGQMQMEFIFPDRMRMTLAGTEMVGVGEKAFIRIGDKWMTAPAQMNKAVGSFSDPKKLDEMVQNCVSARVLGPEKLKDLAVETYEFVNKTKEGTSKSKFYLTPNDLLPRRIDIEADIMGRRVTTKLEYYDYGAPMTIEVPQL